MNFHTSREEFSVTPLAVFYYGDTPIDGVKSFDKQSVIKTLTCKEFNDQLEKGLIRGEVNQQGKQTYGASEVEENRICLRVIGINIVDNVSSKSIIVNATVTPTGKFASIAEYELRVGTFRGCFRVISEHEGGKLRVKSFVAFDRWGRIGEPDYRVPVKDNSTSPKEVTFTPMDKKLKLMTDKSVTISNFDHTIADIPVLEKMYEKGCMIAMIGRTVVATGNGQFRLMGRLSRDVEPYVMRLPILTLSNIIESLTDMSEYEIDLAILRKLLEAGADVPDMSTIPNAKRGNLVHVRPRYMGAVVKLFSFITHDGVQIEN